MRQLLIKQPKISQKIKKDLEVYDPFSRVIVVDEVQKQIILETINSQQFQQPPPAVINTTGITMDAANTGTDLKSQFQLTAINAPIALLDWYGSQGFIGYQFAAILAQHWLISKACTMPAKDAIRKGFDITSNDGDDELTPEIITAIRKADKKYNLNKHMVEFIRLGRVFGIRVALFNIDNKDPKYYEKPFNPDGIKKGSYKGISQIDPYWITPELDFEAAADPASRHFYEPTWWRVSGKRIHRTHLVIYKTEELPAVLKPTYFYGGIPIPQKIFERVYAAERTANEAPMLSLTKRLKVLKMNIDAVTANPQATMGRLEIINQMQNNYGTYLIGTRDEIQQFDTSLQGFDETIMTQYQLVAAGSNVPATKLLGTSPKGFNSSGTYEESSYHEELESLQTLDLTPLIDRHHLCVMRSEIAPEFGIKPIEIMHVWKSLDSLTRKELAEINEINARTDAHLASTGAINGETIVKRIIADPESGYNGIEIETGHEERPDDEGDFELFDDEKDDNPRI